MKKIIRILILALILSAGACHSQEESKDIDFKIDSESRVEIVYYEKLSDDRNSSHYDVRKLDMKGDVFLDYAVFTDVLSSAVEVPYDHQSIVLGIPIGMYEVRIFDDEEWTISIRFDPSGEENVRFEVYAIEEDKAYEKCECQLEKNQELVEFMEYVAAHGVLEHIG